MVMVISTTSPGCFNRKSRAWANWLPLGYVHWLPSPVSRLTVVSPGQPSLMCRRLGTSSCSRRKSTSVYPCLV